jgi:hypothetical protein
MKPVRLCVRDQRVFIEWRCEHGWTTWECRHIHGDLALDHWPIDVECIRCPDCLDNEYLSRVRSGLASLAVAIERRTH